MTNPKVFEFAKEIGMTPLALMDKIREWRLPVKSHMAELEPDMLEAIKQKLKEPAMGTDSSTEKKATTARKKTAATSTTAKTPAAKAVGAATKVAAAKPTTSTKTATKTVTKTVAKTGVKAKETAIETAAPKASPSVVRRKKVSEAEAQVAVVEVEVTQPPVKVVPEHKEEVVAKVAEAPVAAAPTPESPAAVEKKAPGPIRKREVAIGASGVASEQTGGPKRNIIGRMDLSRVQPLSRPGGGGGGPGGERPQRPSGGVGGMAPRPKGNIRAGFFQAPVTPIEIPEDDFAKKKDDRRRKAGGAVTEGGSVREADEAPPAFDAAEFRKREMVFQPKKKKDTLNRPAMKTEITKAAAHKRIVKVYNTMKVSDFAVAMGIKAPELMKHLMKNGVMATINTDLDFDTITLVAPEFGWEAQNVAKTAGEVIAETAFGDLNAEPITRPPVVVVMGHVDHGKTSLLDAIRSANVAAGEAGGITQHIGAYQVSLEDGYKITFLDTPGHEAFTAMRARGANVTDIAVIVVAADDGVMPQTAEAISHAKAANVPMIVAVNKIDKPGANADRVKQQLTEYEVVPEEWGGTTIFCNVSALKKSGIKELLEQIKLLAEVGELKANPKRSGTGTVIEARLEKGRGPVATILVQNGTIEVGQHIVAGAVVGRVRSLINDRGERMESAGPGMPVEILGLDGVPQAGDKFDIVKDERSAEEAAKIRQEQILKANQASTKLSLEDIFAKAKQGDLKELPIVLKADVAGSMEALQGMFAKLATQEVKIKIIHSAIGGITESDVLLASTAKGLIIGFNVRPDGGASNAAKRLGIEIRTYTIVYELIDEMKKAMAGLLAPTVVEKVMGRAEVRNIFTVPKVGTIAGCFVADGKIQRSNTARLIRNGVIVFEGKIGSLKRFKDDAREVATGFECGIGIENFNDIKVGDVIEAFVKEEIARELTPTAEA